ncbi:hypothetical protein [Methylosinus sp. Sm6]|nr:hypothetical protein [Methylosinus sp. Sm6]
MMEGAALLLVGLLAGLVIGFFLGFAVGFYSLARDLTFRRR